MSEKYQAVYYISSCHMLIEKRSPVTNQMVTSSRLTGYIENVMRSPIIKRLMVPAGLGPTPDLKPFAEKGLGLQA